MNAQSRAKRCIHPSVGPANEDADDVQDCSVIPKTYKNTAWDKILEEEVETHGGGASPDATLASVFERAPHVLEREL